MFDTAVNLFESMLVSWFLYSLTGIHKKNARLYLAFMAIFQFVFIMIVNYYSPSQSFYVVIQVAAEYMFLRKTTYFKHFECLFYATVIHTVMAVTNMLICSTTSVLLYGAVDYARLMQSWQIPVFLTAQASHVIAYYYAAVYIRRHTSVLSEKDYGILFSSSIILYCMSACFETIMLKYEHSDLYMLAGDWFAAVFAVLLVYLFRSVYRHSLEEEKTKLSNRIMESQIAGADKIRNMREEVMKVRHDLKHFINIVSADSAFQQSEDVQKTVQQYSQSLSEDFVPIRSRVPAVNYVLNMGLEEAKSKGIDFKCKVNLPGDITTIEESDLVLIMSNMVDNALKHIGVRKEIEVTALIRYNSLYFQVMNSVDFPIVDSNNEILPQFDPDTHGFGLFTVRELLKKYNGQMKMDQKEGNFRIAVIMPLGEKDWMEED